MVLPRFIAAARAGRALRVFGDGRQSRCFCYVGDTVEALVRLQNTPAARGRVFNIGTTEEISILGLAREVIRALRSSSRIVRVPYNRAYAPGFDDMRRRRPKVARLAAVTGFRPATPLVRTIALTVGI